jgi:cytochrome P450
MQIMKYASGRVVFGETLCENEAFLQAMERYSTKVMYYGLILRWINLGRLRDYIMYMVHWKHRRDLAIATRYVTEHIEERKRANANLSEEEKPVDCIQWAMDQPLPDEQKTPEQIAHRLLHLSAGLIGTPATVLVNLLFDTVSHKEYLPELRAEITKCVSEDGRWTESAMAKMKKFDSFIQECFRITPGIVSCACCSVALYFVTIHVNLSSYILVTGWRLVTSETFRFDETLELPKGTLITFPTMFMQHDSDLYPEAEKFDGYRFYRMREEAKKLETASNISKHKPRSSCGIDESPLTHSYSGYQE